MTLDVDQIRAHFPALDGGAVYFDGPGGTQTPDVVADAIREVLLAPLSNRDPGSPGGRNADEAVERARLSIADLVGADPGGVVFGRSMTALTFDLARTLAKGWSAGDEVVVSRLDHDANVRPWVIAAQACGATVRWIDFDPETAELTPSDVETVLGSRTRLVAVTGASNLIGTRPDLPGISRLVHEAGALFAVDGVHLTAHAPIDVAEFGADFYVCSPYKFLGPHCGVLAAPPSVLASLRPDKLLPSSDVVPERFELGTLPYELMAGTTAAIDFLAGLAPGGATTGRERLLASMAALEEHEDELRIQIEEGLAKLPGVRLWSRAASRTPTLLLTFDRFEPAHIGAALAERGIYAPAGTFYAYEPATRLGLEPAGGLRAGLAPYSQQDDVTRLLDALGEVLVSG